MSKLTSSELVKYFQNAVDKKWGYVWSLNGTLYTEAIARKYKERKKSTSEWRDPETYWTEDCAKWFGRMCADCSGGIVGAIRTKNPSYTDRTANTFKNQFTKSGKIDSIPEIPGLAVWRSGHIGIYEGNGYILEFRGTNYGAVRTKVTNRNFTRWGMLRDVIYDEVSNEWVVTRLLKHTNPMQTGDDVRELQVRLNANGFSCGKADGILGKKTKAAVVSYQKAHGLKVDGIAGKNTITKIGGVWIG